jgi:hypothetical protein
LDAGEYQIDEPLVFDVDDITLTSSDSGVAIFLFLFFCAKVPSMQVICIFCFRKGKPETTFPSDDFSNRAHDVSLVARLKVPLLQVVVST